MNFRGTFKFVQVNHCISFYSLTTWGEICLGEKRKRFRGKFPLRYKTEGSLLTYRHWCIWMWCLELLQPPGCHTQLPHYLSTEKQQGKEGRGGRRRDRLLENLAEMLNEPTPGTVPPLNLSLFVQYQIPVLCKPFWIVTSVSRGQKCSYKQPVLSRVWVIHFFTFAFQKYVKGPDSLPGTALQAADRDGWILPPRTPSLGTETDL